MKLCYELVFAILISGCVYGAVENKAKDEVEAIMTEIKRADEEELEAEVNSYLIDTHLSVIQYYTVEDDSIEISLNKETFTETCYVILPNAIMIKTKDLNMKGVKVQKNSDFVSCRITVGPMNNRLLGEWMLCGESDVLRCQPVNIQWHYISFPFLKWPSVTQPKFYHPVHFGGTVSSGIAGPRNLLSCHVITPDGEDLVIKEDIKYPHITRTEGSNPLLCAVAFDINTNMLGAWVVYGVFRSESGQNEIRFPMEFYAYNSDNPYVLAYNVTEQMKGNHQITLGDTYMQKVSGTGKIYSCIYVMPSSDITSQNAEKANNGTKIKNFNSEVSCELSFAPITKEMLGSWQFTVKFRKENQFERKHLFELIEEVLSEPVTTTASRKDEDTEDENVTMLSQIDHFTRMGAMIDVSLNKDTFDEECYVEPPIGAKIKTDLLVMEGVLVQNISSYVACRITIGPMQDKLIGVWMLCGKSLVTEEVRCQPVNIAWNSHNGAVNWVSVSRPRFIHRVNLGDSVHPGVSGALTGKLTSCHVVTPAGEDLVFTQDVMYPRMTTYFNNSASCNILFKNITAEMLGDWVVYGMFQYSLGQNEIRFPLTFVLYNESDPFTQAYNVTTLTDSQHLVRKGVNSYELTISHKTGVLDECIFKTPSDETFDKKTGYDAHSLMGVNLKAALAECVIQFNPITKNACGQWKIFAKFLIGNQFDELRQTFNVVLEDPNNPVEEPTEKVIETLPDKTIITKMGAIHRIVINTSSFVDNETCYLITPDGIQYDFADGFNVSGINIIYEDGVQCGVLFTLKRYEMLGKWTLIAKASMLAIHIERILPFIISLEEDFTIQDDITVREGADVYLHWNSETTQLQTCNLFGPNGKDYTNLVDADPLYSDNCSFIIRNVNSTHDGEWTIEYGYKLKRRGDVAVNVLDFQPLTTDKLKWNVGERIDISLGPDDATYCVIEDNTGEIVYDDFGKCRIVLDKVTVLHSGIWFMNVGVPGNVQLRKRSFTVEVLERGNKPVVATHVEAYKPAAILTCSVSTQYDVEACTFKDPQNNIIVAARGVGQGKYAFYSFDNFDYNKENHNCSMRLANPSVQDLGIWRCAIDTTVGTYYGFLKVGCPFATENADLAAFMVTEPVLTPKMTEIISLEGEPGFLRCYIPASLQYCYFRARNGTIYNVFPGMDAANFEYLGAGLDAGECGIRFSSLSVCDSGNWSCHVGLFDSTAKEQVEIINIYVIAQMEVVLKWQGTSVVVEAIISHPYTLDYCRFVRMDGQGFSMNDIPDDYSIITSSSKVCSLKINNPSMIDLHPWVVAAKITGQDGEISRTTGNLLEIVIEYHLIAKALFWMLIVFLCIIPIIVAFALFRPKNKEMILIRVSNIRDNIRKSWNRTFYKSVEYST